jgi:hypothetical protein
MPNARAPLPPRGKARVIWSDMKRRCFNPKAAQYRHYGGRGIDVCERWLVFENFYADMGDPPLGCSIDRVDNDGNYGPGNCRWADRQQQNKNKRQTRLVTLNGVTKCLKDWCRDLGVPYERILHRINDGGWPIERALLTPERVDREFLKRQRDDAWAERNGGQRDE